MGFMAPNFDLRRGYHAISEFQASLNFFQPVSASLFTSLIQIAQAIALEANLPAPLNRQMIEFNIGGGIPVPQQTSSVGYQRYLANGEVDLAILISPASIIISSNNYKGWHDTFDFVSKTLSRLAAGFIAEMPLVRSFALQYQNEFRSKSIGYVSPAELFSETSPWLAPFQSDSSDLWHCHVGQFRPVSANNRHLLQVNTDVMYMRIPPADQEYLHAKVGVVAASNYDIPGQSPLIFEPDSMSNVVKTELDDLHNVAKKVVKEIFSLQYLDLMNVK
jgi:uncharacterized protein (TIGR04255 family)